MSCDYRHAPEAMFPAAPDDGYAAVRWVADHAEQLGGRTGSLSVAGWSAGANIATVVCAMARDPGGPTIARQLLVTPVTDGVEFSGSYEENADGYVLTAGLLRWFWDHYADVSERSDSCASPLRGDLHGLPPALVVTCEFDPLRDEGVAYATALAGADVDVRHLAADGHVHTSLTAVDALPSGAPIRAEIAEFLGPT